MFNQLGKMLASFCRNATCSMALISNHIFMTLLSVFVKSDRLNWKRGMRLWSTYFKKYIIPMLQKIFFPISQIFLLLCTNTSPKWCLNGCQSSDKNM